MDLLLTGKQQIDILEDPERGIVLSNIAQVAVNASSEVLDLIEIGINNRITKATDANDKSSRSHAIL